VPGNPTIAAVYVTSITVNWSATTGSQGYELDASTASDFSGTLFSSSTTIGTLTGLTFPANLTANTTYFLRAGNIVSNTTFYVNVVPTSTSTLTNSLVNHFSTKCSIPA